MLQRIKLLFSSFDIFHVLITLKKSDDSENTSIPTALFSLVILAATLFYLVINTISVVRYETITSSKEYIVLHSLIVDD